MRWMMVVLIAVACGPSGKQVETAKAAKYQTEAATIYEIALETAKAKFQIAEEDAMQGAFITVGKWYSEDGQSESAGVGNAVLVKDKSMNVALLVQVVKKDGMVTVKVTPIVERFRMGQSNHDKVKPDDPSMPGWVTGKADGLAVEIYESAKTYEAK
jgi:hypothetical protein